MVEDFHQVQSFSKFTAAASKIVQQRADMPAADAAAMYIALLNFTGSVYPDRLEYVDEVLQTCHEVIIPSLFMAH